jgi:hypothetical protein
MTDLGDRLARVLHEAVPTPPNALDPSTIRAGGAPHERRKRLLAPALAAAAVAAVAVGIALATHQVAAFRPSVPHGPAVPPPPDKFSAREFRMAPPPQLVIGGAPFPRATCTPQQIRATAATRRTDGGVLGVIHFIGTVVSHRDGVAERCTLPIAHGPSALIGADGRRLTVPLSGGDRTSRPENPRSDLPLIDGNAIWGFAWLGSYCGPPARAIEIPLHHDREASLRVPLYGPQPVCKPSAGPSMLIDGVAGGPGQPVQPPRPEYASLRLTGRIEAGTTSDQLAPIDLTLLTIGNAPVILDPCPAYAGRDSATAKTGGFGGPINSGYLPCTRHAAVIRPGHPLRWTIPPSSFMQSGPGSGAIPGSIVDVELGIAGVPPLRLQTTAGR